MDQNMEQKLETTVEEVTQNTSVHKTEKKEYIYDAFISYRHTELDKYVAELVHKQMEAFRPPKNIINKPDVPRTKISRVFRDKDELPLASNLEDPIVDALQNSEYLVVICSPRLKESMWCRKEIQTFVKMHGRRKVLAVLIEGEPEESFPDELLYEELETVSDDGTVMPIKKPIEPLAADFRGATKAEIKKAMRNEILRLLAPMFGVSYDDLKQRHKEQRNKRILTGCLIGATLGIAFGTYSTITSIKIKHQAELLAKQQASYLAQEAIQLHDNSNRKASVQLAYDAMTSYQGVKMPKTPEAECALAECMSVYEGAQTLRSAFQVELDGIVSELKMSPNQERVLVSDKQGNLYLVNLADQEIIIKLSDKNEIHNFDFISDDYFFYVSSDEGLKKVDIESKKAYMYEEYELLNFIWSAAVTPDGSTIVLQKSNCVEFVDTESFTKKKVYECNEMVTMEAVTMSEKSDLAYVMVKEDGTEYFTALKTDTAEIAYRIAKPEGDIFDVVTSEDSTYILSSFTQDHIVGKSIITSVNKKTGEVNFMREYDGMMALQLYYANGGQGEHLLMANASRAMILAANHGDVKETYQINESIVKCDPAGDGGFTIYTENGLCHIISPSNEYSDMAFEVLTGKNLKQLMSAAECTVATREKDNRVLIFARLRNADSSVYDGELKEALMEAAISDEAISLAQEKNIPRANFVHSFLEIEDLGLIIINYLDETLVVYDAKTITQLSSYSNCLNSFLSYYGKLKDYYLVSNDFNGYLFDAKGQLHAVVPNFKGVAENEAAVVVYGRDDNNAFADIAIPVYTRQGLLEKTENYLNR